jgi:hypothetical protein
MNQLVLVIDTAHMRPETGRMSANHDVADYARTAAPGVWNA